MERYRSGHNGTDSKSVGGITAPRGFESHPLRHANKKAPSGAFLFAGRRVVRQNPPGFGPSSAQRCETALAQAGDPAGARVAGPKNPNVQGCTGAAKHRDVQERPPSPPCKEKGPVRGLFVCTEPGGSAEATRVRAEHRAAVRDSAGAAGGLRVPGSRRFSGSISDMTAGSRVDSHEIRG